jgi:hypothetical protein
MQGEHELTLTFPAKVEQKIIHWLFSGTENRSNPEPTKELRRARRIEETHDRTSKSLE